MFKHHETQLLDAAKAFVAGFPGFVAHQGPVAGVYFGGRRLLLTAGKEIPSDFFDVCGYFMCVVALSSSFYHTIKDNKELTLFQQIIFKLASIGSILGVFNIASFDTAFDQAVGKNEVAQYGYLAAIGLLSIAAPFAGSLEDLMQNESRALKAVNYSLSKTGVFVGAVFSLFAAQSILFKKEVQPIEADFFAGAIGALLLIHFGAQYQSSTRVISGLNKTLELISPASDFFSIINILSTTPTYADFIKKNNAAAYWQAWYAGCLTVLSIGYGLYRAFEMLSSCIEKSDESPAEFSPLTRGMLEGETASSLSTIRSIDSFNNPLPDVDDDARSEGSTDTIATSISAVINIPEIGIPEIVIEPPSPR